MCIDIEVVARDERYVDHDIVRVSAELLASLNFGLIRMLEEVRKRPSPPHVASQTSITTRGLKYCV
jgi:hypothetical protein